MSAAHITGTRPSPMLLGADHLLWLRRDQLGFYKEMQTRHGDVVPLRLGPYRSWLLFHPEQIEAVLTRQWAGFIRFEKIMTVLRQWNGDSLLLAEGDSWRARRRKVMHAFQTKRLPGYGRVAVDAAARYRNGLIARASGGHVREDIDASMAMLSLDIAARTLFGADRLANAPEIQRAIQILSETAFHESTAPLVLPDWVPSEAKRRKHWAMQVMDDLTTGLVQARLAAGTGPDDLLTSLLHQHDGDAQAVRDDAMSLLIAGHETSGALMCWIFGCLAQEPGWLARVQGELSAQLGKALPAPEDLSRLPVLRAVVDEVLRLYPPAYALFQRQATDTVDLPGVTLRKGDLVQIMPYATQRDPRFFKAPDRFDPERFLHAPTWPTYAYLPFGAGPRVCIGQNFSLMEVCLVVATILQRLAPVAVAPRPDPLPQFSLRPRGGFVIAWTLVEDA